MALPAPLQGIHRTRTSKLLAKMLLNLTTLNKESVPPAKPSGLHIRMLDMVHIQIPFLVYLQSVAWPVWSIYLPLPDVFSGGGTWPEYTQLGNNTEDSKDARHGYWHHHSTAQLPEVP